MRRCCEKCERLDAMMRSLHACCRCFASVLRDVAIAPSELTAHLNDAAICAQPVRC